MDCFENAGRLSAKDYQRATLYSTLSPCDMCSGTALLYKIPKVVIGATIIGVGTSLPELVTSLDAIKKGHADLALGNIVGSCFMNITLILGITLVAAPFSVNIEVFSKLIIFSLISNLFLSYFLSNEKIGWQ